ncbi:CoA transferase [Rhodococcus sp. P1Y]|uniref:CoA transferase n=1 Tax=Rhodococcus sp. P1Y TaxID=1302308 RepID=UPI000EB2C1B6|nr:CoA transferase [Rhodococcus sp. P1Y]AYJ50308.1 CoA transferase [Rhodococcus sp. P1Y]
MESSRQHDWGASGIVALTGPPERNVVPRGDAASWAGRAASALGHLPGFEHGLDGAALLGERAAFTGWTRRGRKSLGGYARLLPHRGGWAVVSCPRPDDANLLGALIGRAVGEDPWTEVAAWLSTRSSPEIVERMDLLGIAGGCVEPQVAQPLPIPTDVRSLEGATVVDFSALWAGPLCAQLLNTAGAHVIKVETPQRPDGARGGNRHFYDLLHGGHESVVLDPSSTTERRWLHRLVDSADIVIEASRPRALQRFGLDAQAHAARGCTWLSITAYGRSSNRIGFGDDVAAACGLVGEDVDGTPVFAGDAIADPLTGLWAALCGLDSVNSRGGRLWDISMAHAVSSTLGDSSCHSVPAQLVPAAAPRHRAVSMSASASGADTREVLRRIGVEP